MDGGGGREGSRWMENELSKFATGRRYRLTIGRSNSPKGDIINVLCEGGEYAFFSNRMITK